MAIVINGSGTVTGISVGGLPDGIVDNGTMADDAIAIADLAATGTASSSTFLRGDNSWQTAGSTSATDLSSGTLARARMPAGSVLQVVQEVFDGTNGASGTSSTSWVSMTDPSPSITTTMLNSKILVSFSSSMRCQGDHGVVAFRREITGGASTDDIGGYNGMVFRDLQVNKFVPVSLQYLDSPAQAAGTTITYKINVFTGGGEVNIGRTWATVNMTLMEVAV